MTSGSMTKTGPARGYCDAVRKKFHEVFGHDCTLPDDRLLARYAVNSSGELILILR